MTTQIMHRFRPHLIVSLRQARKTGPVCQVLGKFDSPDRGASLFSNDFLEHNAQIQHYFDTNYIPFNITKII